jgi:hypothetical protein
VRGGRRVRIKEIKTEIALIKIGMKENQISINKYEKRVAKEKLKKQEKLLEYASIEEAREAFGFGEITETEYCSLCDYFESLEDEKSINELFLIYLKREKKQNLKDLKYLEEELFKEELVEMARN